MAAPQLSKKKFWIIKPKAGRNEIWNPRFDLPNGIAYWSGGYNASISLTGDETRRNAYSMKVITSAAPAYVYYNRGLKVISGLKYTFSCDIKEVAGGVLCVIITNSAGDSKVTKWFKATGYWQRVEVTLLATETNNNYGVGIIRDSNSLEPFYVDGVQFEQTDKATTFICGYEGDGYSWEGAPLKSASLRAFDCKTGGELLDLEDYCQLVQVTGLGHGDWNQILTKMTSGGDLYQGHIRKSRQFSIIVDFIGDTLGEIEANRKAIIDAIRPDLFEGEMVVRYQGFDDNGNEATNPIDIRCIPLPATLTDTPDLPNHQRAVLNFEIPSGLLEGAYREGCELGMYAEFAADSIVRRNLNGRWYEWNGSEYVNPLSGLVGFIKDVKEAPNGDIYVCGNIVSTGGAAKIIRWSKANQTWESLGVTLDTSGHIYCMAFDANGDLYVGGDFTNIAGVTGASYVAKYSFDSETWNAVGSGISHYSESTIIYAIAISSDGTIFIGGRFDTAGGNTNCNYIAYYNGTNWAPLSTGLNNNVYTLKFAPDGRLLIGGIFSKANGANGNNICWWDGSAFKSFTELGAAELSSMVSSIDINPAGTIIIGGSFINAGGDPNADGVAEWRGNNWGALMAGGISGSWPAWVSKVYCISNGDIYISGVFTHAGTLEVDRIAKSVGGAWQMLDITLPTQYSPVNGILEASDGSIYLGGEFSTTSSGGNAIAAKVIDFDVSSGSANTYPYIEVIGPGKLYSIINYTTGAHITFNELTLLEGEIISLNFDPLDLKFFSSWKGRGNVLRYVNAGSNYGNFYLMPGNNTISLFMDKNTTTTDTKAWIAWKPRFWGIDGALLE